MPEQPRHTLIRGPEDFVKVFGVSRETRVKLESYAALLIEWQKAINLVAPSTLDQIWHRHFADSAQLIRHVPPDAKRWLDLGSGAGFPGLVLAILRSESAGGRLPEEESPAQPHGAGGRPPAGESAAHVLIESDARKAAFLREVARRTGIAVDILPERIEFSTTHAKVGKMDVITARALAPMDRLLDLAFPFFSSGTKGLFLKGQGVEAEITAARQRWTFDCRLEPSLTSPEGRVVVIENLREKSEG